jgi:hypothetical protein
MEKTAFKTGRVLLVLGLSWICITGYAQEVKLSKTEQKEAMKAEKLRDYEVLDTLLESRKFAFVTDRIQGTTGATVYNVIQIDEARVFVRCDNPKNTSGRFSGEADNTTPLIGPTGLFFEGDIYNWSLTKNSEELSYLVKFDVNTTGSNPGIFYEIYININPNKTAGVEIKSRYGNYVYTNYLGKIRTL